MIRMLGLSAIVVAGACTGATTEMYRDASIGPDTGQDAGALPDAAAQVDASLPTFQTITVAEFRSRFHLQGLQQSYIDLRPHGECNAARIPDAVCRSLDIVWDGDWIQNGAAVTSVATVFDAPLVFYGTAAMEDTVLAIGRAALDLGYEDVYAITGGIEAWRAMGWYQDINFDGLVATYYDLTNPASPLQAGDVIVDAMDRAFYETGHIAGALQVFAGDIKPGEEFIDGGQALLDVAPLAQTNTIIFYCVDFFCDASRGSSEAARLL